MAHLLFSQNEDQPIKWFEKFDKEEIKTEIKKWLTENPTDTLEHCKEINTTTVDRLYGNMEIINFYEVKNEKPCLVFMRGGKEYYKPLK